MWILTCMWVYIYVHDICMYVWTDILRDMYVYEQRDGLGGKALLRSSLSMALVYTVSLPPSHYDLGKEILR